MARFQKRLMELNQQDFELVQFRLKQLPEKVAIKVFREAGRKGARLVLNAAKALTPRSRKKPKKYSGKPHLQDVLISKQRTYGRGGKSRTVMILGPESKQAPHATLVEKGTRPRWTQHKTDYRTVTTKYTTKSGKLIYKRRKESLGSRLKKNAHGQPAYRGVMPAFRPLEKAFEQNREAVLNLMKNVIDQGIAKELRAK